MEEINSKNERKLVDIAFSNKSDNPNPEINTLEIVVLI